jgi:hypothetical protein
VKAAIRSYLRVMHLAYAVIIMFGLFCSETLAQTGSAKPHSVERTTVSLGINGELVLVGKWSEIKRDTFLTTTVTLLGSDSTLLTVQKDRRTSFVLKSDSLTPRQYIEQFYEVMNVDIGHWSCWAVTSRVEDMQVQDCILWRTVDRCDRETLGLYGADAEFVYRLYISSSGWTQTEQLLCMAHTFEENSTGVFPTRPVCGGTLRMLPDPPPQLPSRSLTGP